MLLPLFISLSEFWPLNFLWDNLDCRDKTYFHSIRCAMICWSVPWPGGLPGSSDFPIAHPEWSMESVQSARSGQLMLMWWTTRSSISWSSRSRILKLHTSRDCYLQCRLVSRAPQQPLWGLLSCWSAWCLDIPTFLILITLLLTSLWSSARMMSRRMWARWRMGMWSSTGIFALLRCETITSSPPKFFWRTWSSQRLGADENASHGTSEICSPPWSFWIRYTGEQHFLLVCPAGTSPPQHWMLPWKEASKIEK